MYLTYDPAIKMVRQIGYDNNFEFIPVNFYASFFSRVGQNSRMAVYEKMRKYFNENRLNDISIDLATVVIKLHEKQPDSVSRQLLNLARYDYARQLSYQEYQPEEKRAAIKKSFREVIQDGTQHPGDVNPLLVNAARQLLCTELAKDPNPDRAEIHALKEAILHAPVNERTQAMFEYAQQV